MSAHPERYVVEYWEDDQPPVSYNAALGAKEARQLAVHNARVHAGRVLVEYSDGTVEAITAYGGGPLGERVT